VIFESESSEIILFKNFPSVELEKIVYRITLTTTKYPMEKRPFYLVAHRCNDAKVAVEKIKDGANAIEVDIRHADGVFYAKHDWPADGRKLSDFLEALCEKIQSEPEELGHFSLLILDCKETDFDVNDLLELVREKLTSLIQGLSTVVSIARFEDRTFFDNIRLSEMEAVSVDESNDVQAVQDYFKEQKLSHYCYANGAFTPEAGREVHRALKEAIGATVEGDSFRLVHVWNLTSKAAMREHIDMGVDGVFVDNIKDLDSVLNEPRYLETVYRPDRTYKPFGGDARIPSYVLEVKTAEETRAGTNANLTFELTGTDVSLTTTIDSSAKGLFESGDTNFVVLTGQHLGKIVSLTVSRDDSKKAPGWFLDNISLVGPDISEPLRFEFNQFIPTSGVTEGPAAVIYELTVQTADVKMAGTNAKLTFELAGLKDGEEKLVKATVDAKHLGMFERGTVDTVKMGGEDIGKIASLTVSRDDKGAAPKWNLAWVSVSRSDDPSEKSFFDFDDWIPETGVTEKPRKEYLLTVVTSDDRMAGTDANLTFILKGTTGKGASVTVNTKAENVCERGATDSFRLTGDDVGIFSSIAVFNDGSGKAPNWKPLYIEVSDTTQSHRFLFDKWIDAWKTVTVEV
jgi:hypothetical protein